MSPDPTARRWPTALLRSAAQTRTMTVAISVLLGACAPKPAQLPAAPAAPGDRPDLTMPRTPSTDASLPSATSVFNAPVAAAPAATAATTTTEPAASAAQARANVEMTPAQESRSMPMPGQANDHSVPVSPPKAAASR